MKAFLRIINKLLQIILFHTGESGHSVAKYPLLWKRRHSAKLTAVT